MKLSRRQFLQLAGAVVVVSDLAHAATVSDWPTRIIRVIVPFAPGGAPDLAARVVAAGVEKLLGQSVIVENKAGANGIVGMETVATAAPDGYTILSVPPAFVINPSVYKILPFEISRDFAAVANIGISPGYLVVVRPDLPVHTIAELIAYAKGKTVLYGSPGVGNTLHLAAALFAAKAGIEMQHVPFRGTAPVVTALLSGTIDLAFVTIASSSSLVAGGQLRAIGFTGKAPLAEMPNVPLVRATVPDFDVEGSWQGWLAPAKTSPEIVGRLNTAVREAVKLPNVQHGISAAGYEPTDMSPAEFEAFLHAEADRYAQAVRAAKIEPQ